MSEFRPSQSILSAALKYLVVGLLAIVFSPLILLVFLFNRIYMAILYLAVWLRWCRNGTRVFVVYSRSPHWQARFEQQLLPSLPRSAIIVNWSDRNSWRGCSLATHVFNNFLGRFEHTPSVIVFRPFRRAKIVRFYKAYQSFKHGNAEPVLALESELLSKC